MKNLEFGLVFLSSFAIFSASAQSKVDSFKVAGNCSMCKKTIEKAATIPGVSSAVWDSKKQLITISYTPSGVALDSLQKLVASAGYDTEKYKASNEAYAKLPECCQYDREKEENTSLENK